MSRLAISRRFGRLASALALLSLVADAGGCVERRMTIRSNPPGAAVYVDDYQIGTTPVAVNYTYYGTRKFRLVKDGFETLTVYQPMPAPWYDVFGVDFFSENVWPGKIRDERSYDYQMSPMVIVSNDQLLNRAEQLRNNGRAIPAAAVQPIVTGPPITAPPVETLPPPGALPPENTLPPPGAFPQPSTISPPINSAPTLPPSGAYAPPAGAPSYAPPGSSVYPPPGGTVSPPPGNLAPNYSPPPTYGPGFSSPGGFGVGGPSPQYGSPGGLFPESAPSAAPQYVPPPTSAPPAAAPPAAAPAPIPYSVPQGWHPMGQLPAGPDEAVAR